MFLLKNASKYLVFYKITVVYVLKKKSMAVFKSHSRRGLYSGLGNDMGHKHFF